MNTNGLDAKQITGVIVLPLLLLIGLVLVYFKDSEIVIAITNNYVLMMTICVVVALLGGILAKKIEKVLDSIDSSGEKPEGYLFIDVICFIDSVLHGQRYNHTKKDR